MEQDHTPVSEPKPRRRPPAGAMAGAALGALVAVFAVLNSQSVKVNWIAASTSTPLIVVIVVFSLIGFTVGAILGGRRRGQR